LGTFLDFVMMESLQKRYLFSSRFKWNLQSNQLSVLLEEKRQHGEKIFDLTESNPTAADFDYPSEALLHALAQSSALRYEPNPRGLLITRQAVSEYYRQRGEEAGVDRIQLTTSTSEAYTFLFKLLTDPGQNVLVPQPSYPLFDFLAGFEGVMLAPYQFIYNNEREEWRIDFDSMSEAINRESRAIILVNPNNPTGSFLKRDELARLIQICTAHQLALIVDEVFSDYAFSSPPDRIETLIGVSEVTTFVMSGISKILGLPQMKLGWIVVNGPETLRRQAQEYLELLADTYLSVSAPVQHAAPKWLELKPILQNQISNRVKANWAFLQTQLANETNCRLLRAEGGWYAIIEMAPPFSEEDFILALLENDNVLVHPGYFFDFQKEGFLVLSLLPQLEIFREGIARLLTRIKSTGNLTVKRNA
jgi:aspartate/methionine/tyrosine aminotransferase